MRVDVATLFPEMFAGPLDHSILKRAREAGLLDVGLVNPRDHTTDKHRTCDDRPFGGGAGMVMKPEPLAATLDALIASRPEQKPHVIFLSPVGKVFQQKRAEELALLPWLVLVCGRYEAIDQRVVDLYANEELSIGDYVLSGGELAALVVIDAVARLLPGALGHPDSASEDSFSPGRGGLLDCPAYTRPPVFRGLAAPEVLISGHHANVARWRRERSLELTFRRRPDLLAGAALDKRDKAFLRRLEQEAVAATLNPPEPAPAQQAFPLGQTPASPPDASLPLAQDAAPLPPAAETSAGASPSPEPPRP
jgi:tRNA (guanine37-N1)-methyltransferase